MSPKKDEAAPWAFTAEVLNFNSPTGSTKLYVREGMGFQSIGVVCNGIYIGKHSSEYKSLQYAMQRNQSAMDYFHAHSKELMHVCCISDVGEAVEILFSAFRGTQEQRKILLDTEQRLQARIRELESCIKQLKQKIGDVFGAAIAKLMAFTPDEVVNPMIIGCDPGISPIDPHRF